MIKKFYNYFIIIFMSLFIMENIGNAQEEIPNFEMFKGIKLENFDKTVNPGDNFYQHVNGNWLKNNPIPAEFGRWGSFIILAEETNKSLKTILENAARSADAAKGSSVQKIGDIYYTGMDSATIESQGYKPIVPFLDMINSVCCKDKLFEAIGYLHSYRLGSLFGFYAGQDKKSSNDVIPQLSQGGLGLPDRDYYTKTDAKSIEIREKYVQHIVNLFRLIGNDEQTSRTNADIIMKIETRLANASMTKLQLRDPEATYNKMNLDELKKLTPDFYWDVYFKTLGLEDKSNFEKGINVGMKDFFTEVNKMINEVSLDDWKVYFNWHIVNRTADLLSSDFVNEDFDFNSRIMGGVKQMQPRWKRILGMVNRSAGELLGKVYVDKMFSPKAKERALEMVNNITATLRERIQNLSWMNDKTKEAALYKLSKFNVKIGYPDKWRDYTGLKINRESFFDNMMKASNFSVNFNLNKIGKPVDRDEWGMTPQTINAYYNPSKNEIVFPAAILQPPFFDADADDALNYGGIGAVIGHEITHGFDDQGRKYDGEGNMKDWWTDEDGNKYKELANTVAEQFDNYTVLDSIRVNGKFTLGENIADLGGLTISFYALEKALKGKEKPVIDGFTPEQRFFISWAQVWRINVTPELSLNFINNDPHSPGIHRVNGPLSNMAEFNTAYNLKEGDNMVRPTDKRVVIW
jgi:putative endopeptidase